MAPSPGTDKKALQHGGVSPSLPCNLPADATIQSKGIRPAKAHGVARADDTVLKERTSQLFSLLLHCKPKSSKSTCFSESEWMASGMGSLLNKGCYRQFKGQARRSCC